MKSFELHAKINEQQRGYRKARNHWIDFFIASKIDETTTNDRNQKNDTSLARNI